MYCELEELNYDGAEINGEHQFDDCEEMIYDRGDDNCDELKLRMFLRIDLFPLNWLDMFLTYGFIARMFNRLTGVCIGVNEYGPEVDEYSEEVGENDCVKGENDCSSFSDVSMYDVSDVV